MTNYSLGFWDVISTVLPENETGDFIYSWLKFVRVHRRFPDRNARVFNDMLFNSKIAPEILNPMRVFSTDKEFFKTIVRAELGESHVVPTLSVLRSEADISNYHFPETFCAKPTHMSGEVEIARGGCVNLDRLKSWLHMSHYRKSRERNYKNLTPKIIIEPLIFGEKDITDYRIFCFRGEPRLICVDIGKYSNYTRAFYSTDWEKQNYSLGHPIHGDKIEKPSCLNDMLDAAATLSRTLDFVRVDFYVNRDHFFLGEMTHSHASASQCFIPMSAEHDASRTLFS